MKWLIASDIHGSAFYCRKLMEAIKTHTPERVILLGDLLYHGPRNPLPEGYAPMEVAAMLNELRPFCVRGNCDAEVDQMVLTFPIMAEYALLPLGDKTVFLTHGHKNGPDDLPPLKQGDILISGHTHVPMDKVINGIRCLNPGSTSLPKEESAHGYMLLDDAGQPSWHNL